MRNLLYIAILLIFSTACGLTGQRHDATAAVLDESAASLTAGDAAEALSKLNAVDLTQLHDSAMMARWALLYSRALVDSRLAAPRTVRTRYIASTTTDAVVWRPNTAKPSA